MADPDKDQKTEAPTPKRLEEAFSRGQFARSPDVAVAFVLLAGLAVLIFTAGDAARRISGYSVGVFGNIGTTPVSTVELGEKLGEAGKLLASLLAPMLAATFVAALVGSGLQTRFKLTTKALEIKWDRLSPVAGFKRVFSLQALMTLVFDLLKLAALSGALWLGVQTILRDPLFHMPAPVARLPSFLHNSAVLFLGWVCGAFAVIAVLNYTYQMFKTARDLRMSKQEVKDELKQHEGDPFVKGHRRRLARRLMQKQMLTAVPTADVVVTNPTHYAVALKYERGKDAAPVLLAKGENRFARRLAALAREHGVPVIENRPVARMLHAMGRVGETIPAELYQTVAEILAFVYRTHRYYFHQLRTRRASIAPAAA